MEKRLLPTYRLDHPGTPLRKTKGLSRICTTSTVPGIDSHVHVSQHMVDQAIVRTSSQWEATAFLSSKHHPRRWSREKKGPWHLSPHLYASRAIQCHSKGVCSVILLVQTKVMIKSCPAPRLKSSCKVGAPIAVYHSIAHYHSLLLFSGCSLSMSHRLLSGTPHPAKRLKLEHVSHDTSETPQEYTPDYIDGVMLAPMVCSGTRQ